MKKAFILTFLFALAAVASTFAQASDRDGAKPAKEQTGKVARPENGDSDIAKAKKQTRTEEGQVEKRRDGEDGRQGKDYKKKGKHKNKGKHKGHHKGKHKAKNKHQHDGQQPPVERPSDQPNGRKSKKQENQNEEAKPKPSRPGSRQ
jgi:hypothetical protein